MDDELIEISFILRLPAPLDEQVKREASSENRSKKQHIKYILKKHFRELQAGGLVPALAPAVAKQ